MPTVPRAPSSILSSVTVDVEAFQSSASVAHPWWSGDEFSPAASTNAIDLGFAFQSAGAITINPAFVKRRSLWTRVVHVLSRNTLVRRSSSSSTASMSSAKSQAAAYAARRCPYSSCTHAVCNRN
ncbi:hypothetical protein CcaverHIS002_0504210 [Cutaneotrichosporon cavernicola]|uniref:Uncharacterized protein n=1 Tax=Cutaneotrichosporon cavernicola TaxID=279322 RepID=A0AA48L6H0_9TREE|nr:uncharacterized protein CcaverHIS019_0504750 [Cutaneotrichosporon cavernicola]BEI85020.1 hypothetical protein CcaverHIS002_0504210 [Cutaneotrichosporon cavernicola]BEI92847.1 hypothetical protein CcaverHIS019_0504750 [Cutaneotrichosporon cavernicola]BEJ00623.1 hypothetical protein CcaverHIS631_0504800 [Cutaneotrichosporon cavernicola]BEJ08390.1 hypothetical protein CcaverHIS641_0504750 [Cutaneotrichosporon cavernicola]